MNTLKPKLFQWSGFLLLLLSTQVYAHGERALEPFIRMRTIQWYDVSWSKAEVKVNDEVTIQGKFHVAEDWPVAIPPPDSAYLNVASPGPVFIRKASIINGTDTVSGTRLQLGGDYDFSIVLKARIPGEYHIHPMMNIRDVGVIVAPGQTITISGAAKDFTNSITTTDGKTIDLETFGLWNGIAWHGFWAVIAVIWTLWWARRPLFILRNRMLKAGYEDRLVTNADRTMAKIILGGTLLLVAGGYVVAERVYPNNIPLQAGRTEIVPLPISAQRVAVKVKRATYQVADRALAMSIEVTNNTGKPIQLGEFHTANVRFINPSGGKVDPNYPAEIMAATGLTMDSNVPLQAGETRTLQVTAMDGVFHTERLANIVKDADSRFGGLLFFYDADGGRYLTSISGSLVPVI